MAIFGFEYIVCILSCVFTLSLFKFSLAKWMELRAKSRAPVSMAINLAFIIILYAIYVLITGFIVLWTKHVIINGMHPAQSLQITLDNVAVLGVVLLTRYYALSRTSGIADRIIFVFDVVFVALCTHFMISVIR